MFPMNINVLKDMPAQIGRIRYCASHVRSMTHEGLRRHLIDIADALEPLKLSGEDEARLMAAFPEARPVARVEFGS
jgi:hypothetical protein